MRIAKSGGKRDENKAASAATGLPAPSGVLNALLARQAATSSKNPAAVALGRLGGLKGGKARADALTSKEQSEIAKKGAAARWEAKRRADILTRVRNGETTAEIAKELHISPEMVRAMRMKLTDALRSTKQHVSDAGRGLQMTQTAGSSSTGTSAATRHQMPSSSAWI